MRILLLGAQGQVGHELRRSLAGFGEVLAGTRSGGLDDGSPCVAIDLGDPASLRAAVEHCAPDLVVNAAAYTAVDRAEDEPELAFRINAQAPGELAEACRSLGSRLVHFSTDYVFDGSGDRPWREDDLPAPLGVYGASKLAGEQAIRDSGAEHMIFRLAWVYAARGHNFLLTMLRIAGGGKPIRVVDDQQGAPTSAARIADGVAAALRARPDAVGTWHLAASGQCSWHGFADAIFTEAVAAGLLPSRPVLEAITSDQFPTRARRPAYSRLDCTKLERDFGLHIGDWRAGLQDVTAELAAQARAT